MQKAAGKGQSIVFIPVICFLPLVFSCNTQLRPIKAETAYYNISNATLGVDSSVIKFIQPYHDSLSKEMEQVVATSEMMLDKNKPESLLGNFIADLLLEKSNDYGNVTADFCVVNYGGLRVPFLPAGEITRGMIFELMPFDNFLVTMELSGNVVQQMLDHIASQGGWPVSGLKFKIKNGKAFEILINNIPLQPGKKYRVVMSDYLADGGDNLSMLIGGERINSGMFIRDVILEYLQEQSREGKKISSQLDNRIVAE